nr:DNA-binding domain-containing protein [uncultured Undibacterium sp.]
MSVDLQTLQASIAHLLSARKKPVTPPIFSTAPEVLEARIAIYRGNLQAVWTNALRNAYPVIERLAGADFFAQLAVLYAQKYPSQSGDLHEFGDYFSAFLEAEKSVADFPYFAAVAALEWQIHRLYYAADAQAISLNHFMANAGVSPSDCTLQFHPATSLFHASFAAVQIYLAHQHAEVQALNVDLHTPSFAIVSRDVWRLQVTQLSQAEFVGLSALHQGQSLGNAFEAAMDVDGDFNVAHALQSWFALDIFIDFICKN